MNENQATMTAEQLKRLAAELAFKLARMQAWTLACTEMGIEVARRKEIHQYVDILHRYLSNEEEVNFSELLRAMWKLDDCMISILQHKIEDLNK